MPLTLPRLDDRAYADLVEEARALIPSVYPEWTDHNPSDPGITLIELFAWLTEMLIYRTDQVPDRHRLTFLKLLNGPDRKTSLIEAANLDPDTRARLLTLLYGPVDASPELLAAYRAEQRNPPPDLVEEAIRVTIIGLRQRNRAVTGQDFVSLAQEASADIARVLCVPRRDLEAGTEAARTANQPGHVSVLVVPLVFAVTTQTLVRLAADGLPAELIQVRGEEMSGALLPLRGREFTGEAAFTDALRAAIGDTLLTQFKAQIARRSYATSPRLSNALRDLVWKYLDERRTLTTRHHVVGPFYAPLRVQVLAARRSDARADLARAAVAQALVDFLHPLSGGHDGKGWPFGRDIYVSELYELLEAVPGIDYVPDIALTSACAPGDTSCIVANQVWHDDGDLIGLRLEAHHLPALQLDRVTVVVAAGFVPVQLKVRARVRFLADVAPASVQRAVKNALRLRFSPLRHDPDGENLDGGKNWAVTRDTIQADDLNELRTRATVITLNALRVLVRQALRPFVAQEADVLSLEIDLQPDASWVIRDRLENDVGVGSRAQELADLHVVIELA